jgi:hypothetical protein
MSAGQLKRALQKMPETGAIGFENLVRRLLELSLKEPFVLARSGDQPSGDAHNLRRNVCLQAKRYSEGSPNAKNIEGDFDESLRSLPNTDVYVLAVTRGTAQLDDTCNAMREKSAVDLIVWDFAADDSALPVLCVEYWDQLLNFPALRDIDGQLHGWVSNVRGEPSHKERVGQLQAALRDCTQTLGIVREAAESYLSRRFQLSSPEPTLPLQPIRLIGAVDRNRYTTMALDWWHKNEKRVLVMSAPEGYGKTWVAAQGARCISLEPETIVLWLDCIQWRECTSVDAVLAEAVSRITDGDREKIQRLVRKLRDRWSNLTLLVLDGVSERNALPAAQRILEDLTVRHPGACRVLFTTRPLNTAVGFDSLLWERQQGNKIDAFDDSELNVALAHAQIPPQELTVRLRSIARIPRYFATCVRLRAKLRKLENISVALVLWNDLLDKIAGLEPEIRQALGFTCPTDAIEVLVRLAKALPEAVGDGKGQHLLNACFGGKYAEVRNYLKEIRILAQAGPFEAKLSPEHTILGKALLVWQVLQRLPSLSILQAADRLAEVLEPLASEDGSAEAFFVALQLTINQENARETRLGQDRAALLIAWVFSHNSNASDERLEFWCGFDPGAYALFVESVFEQLYRADTQEFIVTPLARVWRDGGTPSQTLESCLRRWLKLLWFEGCSGSEFEHKGYHLPVAATENQVRLASLAISLLSVRRELSFLRDLAVCCATESLTWKQVQEHRFSFKSVYENVAMLMRWHYTERVVPDLTRLANENVSDELLLEGLRHLAATLKIADVPDVLRLPTAEPFPYYVGTPAAEMIRKGQRVFGDQRTQPFPNEMDFSRLAVRQDLPPLCAEDVASILEKTRKIVRDGILHVSNSQTIDDAHLYALWPWFAKFFPMELAQIAGELHLEALRRKEPSRVQPMLWFLGGVLPKLNRIQLAEWEQFANEHASRMEVVDGILKEQTGLFIAEAAFLVLSDDALVNWFIATSQSEARRHGMCFGPMMELIPLRTPRAMRELAVQNCFQLADSALFNSERPPTESEYWYYITGLTTAPDARLHELAKQQLLKFGSQKPNLSLLRLWLRSAAAGQLEDDLSRPELAKFLDGTALRVWALSGELNFDPNLMTGSYEDLMSTLPQTFVGGVLALSDRKADLDRWGRELFAVAVRELGRPPFQRRSHVATEVHLAENGNVRGVGLESPVAESQAWSGTAGFWGVEYSGLADIVASGNRQEVLDDELARWRLDENQIRLWEHYELHTFGGSPALDAWSRLFPEEFLPRARALLQSATRDPKLQWHLGGFLQAATCCFLRLSPSEAWQYYLSFQHGRLGVTVRSDYDVPEFFHTLWNLQRCASPEHDDLRNSFFENCLNEFEVMIGCVAALANRTETWLTQFAEKQLAHDLARERALGVSVLAWVGTSTSTDRLDQVIEQDPNYWVRGHAKWAKEVTLQEYSARTLLRQLAHEDDPYKLSAGLQVLKVALTPLARWWAPAILREERAKRRELDPRCAAVMESFWYHFRSTHSSRVEVFGRYLEDFCRGEKLDRLKVSKLIPWWRIH